jgi:TP901 family phage tail tape measure protein
MANEVAGAFVSVMPSLRDGMPKLTKEAQNGGGLVGKLMGSSITKALTAAGAAAAVKGGLALRAFMPFEDAMASLQVRTSATEAEMDLMTRTAREMGRVSGFSATEAAKAMYVLAGAGLSVAQMADGALEPALNLAAASGLNLKAATDIVGNSIRTFGLNTRDAARVADVFAGAAANSKLYVDELGVGMKNVGPTASALGVTIEQSAGALAVLRMNGIGAAQGGTQLRAMLMELTAPTQAAQRVMASLGLEMRDNEGNFIGIESAVRQLEGAVYGLGEVPKVELLNSIFGVQGAGAALNLLRSGADELGRWEGVLSEYGFAADAAATKSGTLSGRMQGLRSMWDTFMSTVGEGLAGPLHTWLGWKELGMDKLLRYTDVFVEAGRGIGGFIAAFDVAAWSLAAVFQQALQNAITSLDNFLAGILYGSAESGQLFGNVFGETLLPSLLTGLRVAFRSLLNTLTGEQMGSLVTTLLGLKNELRLTAIEFLTAIVEALPGVIDTLLGKVNTDLILGLADGLLSGVERLVSAGLALFMAVVDAVPQVVPPLLGAVTGFLPELVGALLWMLPMLLGTGIDVFHSLVDAV